MAVHMLGGGQIPLRAKTNLDTFFDSETGTPKKSPESIALSTPDGHGTVCAKCGAWRGAYGLEPTVEMYVAHSLEILRELRRVLRKDGVLFWNLGDSYANDGKWGGETGGMQSYLEDDDRKRTGREKRRTGLKHKDLVLMPFRIALAAQADVSVRNGKEEAWWVRSVIIWAKPNPMPESVTDRPTDSYEHILMLTKSARYFWDADAVREPLKESSLERGYSDAYFENASPKMLAAPDDVRAKGNWRANPYIPGGRNMRNLWEFPTQPYAGAHFATFPEELPRRCILAATSARGCCAQCGAPWERVSERTVENKSGSGTSGIPPVGKMAGGDQVREDHDVRMGPCVESRTIGWSPTCRCRGQRAEKNGVVPCVVLDPFGGSGTTGRVAIELGRRAVLLDLAYGRETAEDRAKGRSYAALAKERTQRSPGAPAPALAFRCFFSNHFPFSIFQCPGLIGARCFSRVRRFCCVLLTLWRARARRERVPRTYMP